MTRTDLKATIRATVNSLPSSQSHLWDEPSDCDALDQPRAEVNVDLISSEVAS